MATDVIMPQMGESIAEGTITRWIKNVGDTISRDEPLFEISTDKVDAEIPSPAAGTLTEILVQPGQTVAVNTVVARIGEAGEARGAAPPAAAAEPEKRAAEPAAAPAAARPEPARETERPAAVSPAAPPAPAPAPARAPSPSPTASTPAPEAPAAAPALKPAESDSFEDRVRTRSSPLVRKIAQDNGVTIGEVEGTGIAGRVTKNDILSFIDNRKSAPRPAPAPARGGAAPAAAASAPAARADRDEIVPMSVMRRKIAERMVESKRTSAHVATVFSVDYSAIERLRRQNKEAFFQANGVKLTYMPFIFQAVTAALKKFPDLNASIDGEEVIHHRDIHLGMAVALDWGLIVPVIKNADEKSILGLARATNDLAERARSKKLKPDEVSGGTFTVTNPGVYGSLFGTPIIVQPQVAILGVGTIEKRPVVVEDEDGNDALGIRTMGYLALSFDHRLIDGAVADQFMAEIQKTLEAGSFSLA
jgi:2-oxoglutarate dehydrogenase E2 component (dihydrolipoamide succinyltransferase)